MTKSTRTIAIDKSFMVYLKYSSNYAEAEDNSERFYNYF
jgi:hypothetical protein